MAKRTKPTPKEWAFIKSYAIGFNATEAYMEATGDTNRSNAAVQGHRYLKHPIVAEHLASYIQEILGPHEKTLLGNVKFWISVRDETHTKYLVPLESLEEILEKHPEAFQVVKDSGKCIQIHAAKTTDRLKASEHLAKYAQMFVERKEVDLKASVQIVDDL